MYTLIKMSINIDDNYKQEPCDLVFDYLAILYKNGQIMKDWSLLKKNNNYIAYANVADIEALDNKYNNSYAKNYLKNLTMSFEIIGDNIVFEDTCHCLNSNWYMLYSDYQQEDSPIICGDCGKEFPLYKVPHIFNEDEHYHILEWQRNYKSIDQLWIHSLSDRFTKNQIINPDSSLNKQGLEICKQLELVLKKPVYLYLHNPIGGFYKYEKNNRVLDFCPKCGEKWIQSKRTQTVDCICEKCRLAVDATREE